MKIKLLLFAVLLCTTSAFSQLLTFEFSGSVSEISIGEETENVPDVAVGQSFTGWFSYDNSVDGVENPHDISNSYGYDQITSAHVNVGDILISYNSQPVEIYVDNDQYNSREDRNEDHFYYNFYTQIPEFGSNYVHSHISFIDTTALAFDGFDLPTSFDLTAFDIAQLYIVQSPGFGITAQIDEITLIPEPCTLAMLALGGVLIRRRRA